MDNILRHVGILGMHWGIRRKGSTGSGSGKVRGGSSSAKPVTSPDHVKAASLKRKKLSQMSNEELKTLTTRLQLEKQYKDLTKSDIGAGQKFVSEVLMGAGKQIASKYVASAFEGGGKSLIEILKKRAEG